MDVKPSTHTVFFVEELFSSSSPVDGWYGWMKSNRYSPPYNNGQFDKAKYAKESYNQLSEEATAHSNSGATIFPRTLRKFQILLASS